MAKVQRAIQPRDLRRSLLNENFLPSASKFREEIPGNVRSESFERAAGALTATSWKSPDRGDLLGFSTAAFRTTHFTLVPRYSEIPHPVAYAHLVKVLQDNWVEFKHVEFGAHSQIRPWLRSDGRIATMHSAGPESHGGVGAEYRVVTDISRFYDSIYTHAIVWALKGKKWAKANKSGGYANALDSALRCARRGETTGVSIGPGTSLIVSELLLGAVDKSLAERGYEFERYIDDYRCFVRTENDARNFIRDLAAALGGLNLRLNDRKTEIQRLPQAERPEWLLEVRRVVDSSASYLLDHGVYLSERFPDGSVLRYAIRAALEGRGDMSEIEINAVVRRLARLAAFRPVAVAPMCRLIAAHEDLIEGISDGLIQLLKIHSQERRSDAMCWLLSTLWFLGEEVPGDACDSVMASGDMLAIATLLAMEQDGLAKGASTLAVDIADGTGDDYQSDEAWPVLYQHFLGKNDARAERFGFAELKAANVRFIHAPKASDFDPPVQPGTGPSGVPLGTPYGG